MGTVVSESVMDAEAVRTFIEMIAKTKAELKEDKMCGKIKDCHGKRLRSHQHQGGCPVGYRI